MKSYKNPLTILLVMVILFCITGFTQAETSMTGHMEPERVGELTELRESNSKTYLLSDGTLQWVGYAEDIHYLDQNGEYKEISNHIIVENFRASDADYKYKNEANSFTIRFADILDVADSCPIMIEYQGKSVTFAPVGGKVSTAAKSASIESKALSAIVTDTQNCILYKDIYQNTDFIYEAKSYGIKEYIILNQPTGKNEFVFNIKLDGLKVREDDGGVIFVNEDDNVIFHIGQLSAIDDDGMETQDVQCTVMENNDSYQLKLTVDEAYLTDKNRAYPVVIDPSIMITGSSVTFDSYVSSRYPDTNYYLNNYLRTGRDSDYYVRRTFIRFTLPTYIPATNVTSAYLRMEKYSGATPSVKAYRVTSSWGSSTITWNNQPGYTTTDASPSAYNDSGNWWRMTITNIVKTWIAGTYSNNGFLVRDATESGTSQWTTFYSSDAPSPHKPELHIVYDDDRFLSYGWPSSSVPMYPYSYNIIWQTAMDQSRSNWNNTSTPIDFYTSSGSSNMIYAAQYDWDAYGMMTPTTSGSELTQFTIRLNSRRISEDATNISNFIQSVFVHELGHTIWLEDNPITELSSIMKYNRDRDTMTNPSAYDVEGVNMKY